jgi:hypothetical protein
VLATPPKIHRMKTGGLRFALNLLRFSRYPGVSRQRA